MGSFFMPIQSLLAEYDPIPDNETYKGKAVVALFDGAAGLRIRHNRVFHQLAH